MAGASASSWAISAIPSLRASRGVAYLTARASMNISPSSGRTTPPSDFAESRFAGSVRAHKTMHAAGLDVQAHVIEGARSGA